MQGAEGAVAGRGWSGWNQVEEIWRKGGEVGDGR